MRVIPALLVVALCSVFVFASAMLVAAGAPKFTVCSGSDALLQDVVVTTDVPDWSSDTTVHFTIAGTLKETFENGNIKTLAYFDGIEVTNEEQPICSYEGTPFVCPEQAGNKQWTFPLPIPSVPWSGNLESHSDFKTADGKTILCLDLIVGL